MIDWIIIGGCFVAVIASGIALSKMGYVPYDDDDFIPPVL